MPDLFCNIHGPYDASYGTCPYCSGRANRPPAPAPLDDDLPTDIGLAGGAQGYGGYGDDDSPTEIPGRRGGNFLDSDDDPTELGVRFRQEDVTEIEFAETGVLGLLWVKEGSRRGHIYRIKDGATIGRSKGDVVLDDPKVSNPHAKLTLEDEKFVVWDFGSRNGTFVNGEKIRAATILEENDSIKIGDQVFVLKILA